MLSLEPDYHNGILLLSSSCIIHPNWTTGSRISIPRVPIKTKYRRGSGTRSRFGEVNSEITVVHQCCNTKSEGIRLRDNPCSNLACCLRTFHLDLLNLYFQNETYPYCCAVTRRLSQIQSGPVREQCRPLCMCLSLNKVPTLPSSDEI